MDFDEIAKEIDIIINKFNDDIDEVMRRVSLAISQWMISNDISTTTSLSFDKAFNDMLYEAGYYDLVNKFVDDEYDKLYPIIKESFLISGISTTFNKSNLDNIMAIKALDTNKFSILASTASSTLRESLTKYAISNYSEVDMMEALQNEFMGTSLYKHSKTIADSSISEFHQSVINMKAEEYKGEKVWIYKGKAIDEKTRDFCKCIIKAEHYYTDEEKNGMESNPKRKYNCRHHFRWVTPEYAEEMEGLTPSKGKVCN